MDSRFTLKDFVFAVLIVGVIAAVLLAMWQFSYNEQRLNELRSEIATLNSFQKLQLATLEDIRATLRKGVSVSSGGTTTSNLASTGPEAKPSGLVRKKTADGGQYVYAAKPVRSPHAPQNLANFTPGDWFVNNIGSEPAVITPYIDKDAYGSQVQGPVLESLVSRNPETFEFEPFLAESFEVSGDGLTFKFVLRREACFSDGKPVTADDVVFSFNTLMGEGIDSERQKGYFDNVASCTKVDERTVLFKMKRPYFKAMEVCGGLEIIPRHIYQWTKAEEYNKRNALLVGSGPYVLKEWKSGQRIVQVPNERYWTERPAYNRVVFRFIQNPQAALQSFLNGDIDQFIPLPDQYLAYTKDAEFTSKFKYYLLTIPNAGYRYVGWNLTKPCFKDKETRQALTMLIDRMAIINTIQKKQSIPLSGPFAPMTPQYDQSIAPLPYAPEEARKKLAAAGWKLNADNLLERAGQVFKFDLAIPSQTPEYQKISEYIKEQLKKAGITVVISPYEFSVLVDRLDNRQFDAAMLGWTGGIEGDPFQIWHSKSIANKGSNFVSFRNAEADKLIDEGRATLDEAKRMQIWHKLHRLIAEEQPYTFLSYAMQRRFINGRFENTTPTKNGLNPWDWFVPVEKQKYR